MSKKLIITAGSVAGALLALYGVAKLLNPELSLQYATVPWVIKYVHAEIAPSKSLLEEIYVNDLERDNRHKHRKRCKGDYSDDIKSDIRDIEKLIKQYDGAYPAYRSMAQSSICDDLGVKYNGPH